MARNLNQAKAILSLAAVAVLIVAVGSVLRKSHSSSGPSSGLSALTATDKNGDKWVLEMASVPILPTSGDGSAKTGEPLAIITDVQIADRDVSIGLIIAGQGGETYTPAVQKNGQRLPVPGLKILDEAGKTLAADTFQYG